VKRWWSGYKEEGHIEARKRLGSKPKIDVKALETYVLAHPNVRLKDLSTMFGISVNSISCWLRKLNFSYKKRGFLLGSRP
jgi:transposase